MTFDPLKKGVAGVEKFDPKFFENLHQNHPENAIKSISAAKSSGSHIIQQMVPHYIARVI